MALNMDAVLKIVAKVQGVNEFKALTDSIDTVGAASKSSGTGLQQLSAESGKLTQEAAKSTGSVRAQSAALQELQARARGNAAELSKLTAEARGLGVSVADLRGRSAGVLDGLATSAAKGANGIRQLQRGLQPTDAALARVRDEVLALGNASKQSERSLEQQAAALKNIRAQAEVNGQLYRKLTGDIQQLQAASKGLSGSSEAAATGFKRVAASSVDASGSIRQQIQSLTALQGSLKAAGVDMGATAQQVDALKRRAAEMGQAWEPGIRGLKLLAQASTESTTQQANNMTRLQGVLSKAGEGYQRLGREIDSLRQKAAGLDLSKGLNITPGSVASGVGGAVRNIVQMRQDLARSMTGRVVLTGEGLAAAGVAGAAGAGAASGLGGMASGAQAVAASLDAIAAKASALPGILKPLGGLLSEPASAAAAGVGQWSAALTSAQAKLQALATPFEAIGTAISSIGPETAAVAGVASLAIAGVYQVLKKQADEAQADLEQSFKGISDSAQKVLQDLVRIYDKVPNARLEAQQQLRDRNMQRLGEVPADSIEARRAANAVAAAEREITKIQEERNALLDGARQRQNASTEALQRQVAAGRADVNQARERLALAERVADVQRAAAQRRLEIAAAQQQQREDQRQNAVAEAMQRQVAAGRVEINQARERLALAERVAAVQRSAAQRRLEIEQRIADADLSNRAAAAFAPSRTLALPAAGQTAFQGTVNAAGLGGGARARLQNFETAGTRDAIGAAMASRSAQAMEQQAQATQRTRGKLAELFVTIDKVTASSNGSIQSLQRQRAAWEALRVAVNPAAPAYEKARAKVQQLDEQLKRLTLTQEKAQRSGVGREAIGGALGALATGGGLQSAVGSLAGSLAFSGSAAGLAAGAGITAVAGAGALAARTGVEAESAQVRLKALTDQFGEYNAAQSAAATIAKTLRISNTEAQASFANLYASLRPTGIQIKELEDAYIGFAAAARNSGATAQETSNALIQLKQGLASGALQGEELRSIREQAPLVAQAIAKQFGVMNKDVDVSIGNLKQFAAEGKITTEVVLQALSKLRGTELGKLGQQFNTAQQAVTDFQNSVNELGVVMSRVFGPVALTVLREVTRELKSFTAQLDSVIRGINALRGDKRARGEQEDMRRAEAQAEREAYGSNKFNSQKAYNTYVKRRDELFRQFQDARNVDTPNATQQANRDTAARERAQAAARAQDEATKKQREEQQKIFEDELKIRQDAEKRLADAAQQREEQIDAFRQETIRRAADLERQLGDQRRDIEREIAASRLATTRAQQDLDLDLRLQAGGSTYDKAAIEQAKVLRDITRQFEDQVLQGRQTALDRQLTLQRQLEQFKIDTAQGIGKIEEAYAKSVSAILQDAGQKLSEKMQEGAQLAAATLAGAMPAGGAGGGAGGSATIASIADSSLNANARAWLAAIRGAEGTAGPNGYRTMFGGGLFSDMSRHPDRVIRSGGYASAAAGAYQFMPDTWRGVGGGPMTPERQDRAALALALRRGVDLSRAPFTRENVAKLAPEWASLPTLRGGSFYGQPSWTFGALSNVFTRASGMPAPPVLPPAAPRVAPVTDPNLGSAAVAQANQQVQRRAQELERQQQQAQVESRRAAFTAMVSNIGQSLTAAQSELTGRADSARQGLEDAVRYEQLLKEGITPELAQQRVELERIAMVELGKQVKTKEDLELKIKSGERTTKEKEALQAQLDVVNKRIAAIPAIIGGIETEIDATKRLKKAREDAEGRDVGKGLRDGVEGYLTQIGTLAEGIKGVTGNALKGLEDQMVEFVTTGKAAFNELAASILKDMSRVIIQQMVLAPILGGLFPPAAGGSAGALFGMPMLTGVPGLNAVGNVYGPGGIIPFATGGVVNSPTLFQFAGGTGLMGEAGPEAIVPLRRGKDGKLGIVSTGGGSTSVVVNVNMQTGQSETRATSTDGQQLGRAVSEAVQAELIRQKRPGGLLYA